MLTGREYMEGYFDAGLAVLFTSQAPEKDAKKFGEWKAERIGSREFAAGMAARLETRNLGVLLHDSGLVGIDVDSVEARDWLREHAPWLPVTVTTRTVRGWHYLYRIDGPVDRCKFEVDKNLKRQGMSRGIMLLPPSRRPDADGYVYRFEDGRAPWECGFATLTGDQVDRLEALFPPPSGPAERVPDGPIREGGRHNTLVSLAGSMRRRGMSATAIRVALLEENAGRCVPPLDADEVAVIARDIGAKTPADPVGGNGMTARALSDIGNGERLLDRHGDDLRYCHGYGAWFVWDGTRWARDTTGEVERRAKDTLTAGIAVEVASADDSRREATMKHAARSQSAQRVRACIEMASSDPRAVVRPEDLDADQMVLNVENGTLDLKTRVLRPHDRVDLITRVAPVEFTPEAEGPGWQAFIGRVLPDDEVRGYVQRAAGYALTGKADEHVLSVFLGGGANGKSVLTRTLLDLLGDYAVTGAHDLLIQNRRAGGASPEIAELAGRRLVIVSETDEGAPLAEGRVKALVGGDKTKGRGLYQGYQEIEQTWTMVLVTNHAPVVTGTDNAIWRRLALVPFGVTIPEEERDPRLTGRLARERPAILNWALDGLADWLARGLDPPGCVRAATSDYREDNDPMRDWLDERVVRSPYAVTTFTDLYNDYKAFVPKGIAVGGGHFRERLKAEGFEPVRDMNRRGWRGVILMEGGSHDTP